MRCFLALPLPPSDAAVLVALQNRLPVGRTVTEDNLHLTLVFLDDQPEDTLQDIHEAMETLHAPPVTLTLSGFETTGGKGGHALAVIGDGGPALRDLQGRILSRLRGIGLQLDRRRFRPHVTLARLPAQLSPEGQDRMARFLTSEGTFSLPDIRITRFALYQSFLRRDGAEYEELASYPLV
ncbi:RNA 2',3'-cyclic phosphodiesterase [Puniceibacterium sp. IMCC21224]|uniref:RNA 2',3'-cyclic phosphodiesterase n=1 Tax=Puniceibacterium sp. IMCC21224 TaxID=1618204 RepID=UPI00064DB4C5|nr:RNA 2',3'-cyclic phosphodiesterase [Puniceibacterium sp. IMCC21224]KMK68768.1 2'-5' RNA ligase [Puniceibacterium sp. IMCC21224]